MNDSQTASIRKRTFGLAVALMVAGALSFFHLSQAATVRKDEAFMEQHAPGDIPGYSYEPGQDGGMRYTYKMDEGTYKTLHPFGIVAKRFSNSDGVFDAVLISSDSHESFHDPKICFSAQGWTFGDMREENIDIPGRGSIPFTVVQMHGPENNSVAAYCYKGPNGFVANPKHLQLDMFKEVLFGKKPMDSTFYRFMPATDNVGFPELKKFIQAYMSVAPKESGDYY